MENTLTQDRGQNLFTTSTGTAHHYRPGYYFPSSNYRVNIYRLNIFFFYIVANCLFNSMYKVRIERPDTSKSKRQE